VVTIALWVSFTLGIPLIVLCIYIWYKCGMAKHRYEKQSAKAAFGLGLKKLSNKYQNFVKKAGTSNVNPSKVFESDLRGPPAKKGFKMLG
jgi:hypothetical protein